MDWMRHVGIYLAVMAIVVAMALALVLMAPQWFRHIRRLLVLGGVVDVDDVDADASASVINLREPFRFGGGGQAGQDHSQGCELLGRVGPIKSSTGRWKINEKA